MPSRRFCSAVLCAAATAAICQLAAHAQAPSNIKPGLYEATSEMVWNKSPFPNGMTPPSRPATSRSCVTQELIDRFSGPAPQAQHGCNISNLHTSPTGASGTMTCKGDLNGSGNFESHVELDGSIKSVLHFTGTMSVGEIDWDVKSTAHYLGPDCGSVKPYVPPANK